MKRFFRSGLVGGIILFSFTAGAAPGSPATLTVKTDGNNLQFVPKTLSVHAGQRVTLKFENAASADSGMSHTWTLVQPGKADEVSASGASAGPSKDYIADEAKGSVIIHTHLVAPGKSQTLHFTAPKTPGDYPFICTYPSHYPSMKGTLTVTP